MFQLSMIFVHVHYHLLLYTAVQKESGLAWHEYRVIVQGAYNLVRFERSGRRAVAVRHTLNYTRQSMFLY